MQVRCRSGLMGERSLLRTRYRDFEEFKAYCRNYGIHRRLGYRSMKAAWEANPVIESSTDPSDLRKVPAKELEFFRYVELPKADCDVVIVFPGGDELLIQARPSNADTDYNGSLDIILPDDQEVCCWIGSEMTPAPAVGRQAHVRLAEQLVTELPGDYS